MEECERRGVHSSVFITKCDRIETALNFIKLEKTLPSDHARQSEVRNVQDRLNA